MNARRRRRVLVLLLGAVLTVSTGLVAPTLAAESAGDTRADVVAAYRQVQAALEVPAGWTGSVSQCRVGTESRASLDATSATINILRDLAGVAPITLDPELNRKALAAALMMDAQNDLSHDPGPQWACYSQDGAEGAGSSDLYLGLSGAAAMVGFVDDEGIDSLGHRRWLLRPTATTFGTGSTGNANALYVFGETTDVPDGTLVAWPPPGHMPIPWVFRDWSVGIGAERQQVDVSQARIAVTVDGAPVTVSGVRDLGDGYGSGGTLTWRVRLPEAARTGDHAVAVSIDGVVVDGAPAPLGWQTTLVDVEGGPDSEPERPPAFGRAPTIARADGGSDGLRPGVVVRAAYRVSRAESVSFRWLRDGRAVPGASARTYSIRRADGGHRLAVRVVATGPGGRATATSPARAIRSVARG